MIGDSAFWFFIGVITVIALVWGFNDLDESEQRYKEWQKKSDSSQAKRTIA